MMAIRKSYRTPLMMKGCCDGVHVLLISTNNTRGKNNKHLKKNETHCEVMSISKYSSNVQYQNILPTCRAQHEAKVHPWEQPITSRKSMKGHCNRKEEPVLRWFLHSAEIQHRLKYTSNSKSSRNALSDEARGYRKDNQREKSIARHFSVLEPKLLKN